MFCLHYSFDHLKKSTKNYPNITPKEYVYGNEKSKRKGSTSVEESRQSHCYTETIEARLLSVNKDNNGFIVSKQSSDVSFSRKILQNAGFNIKY